MYRKKDLRFKISWEFCECLSLVIEERLMQTRPQSDEIKLLQAILYDVLLKLRLKLVLYKPKYSISLKAEQSFALRLLYAYYSHHKCVNPWFDNEFRQLADRVHQYYQ